MVYGIIGNILVRVMDDYDWTFINSFMDEEEEVLSTIFWPFVFLFALSKKVGTQLYNLISKKGKDGK